MKIVQVPINNLKFSEYNPRKASEKEVNDLKASIKEFGFAEPIVVNGAKNRSNVIVGGHFRAKVAKELGYKTIPVVYVNIPDIKKEQELNLRLNKNTGHWDFEMLANFEENQLLEVGFGSEELDQIFGLEEADEFDEQKEFEKAVKNPRGCRTGDLWQLGDHKLLIGDCVDRKNWERLLREERFDFILTDPPYRLAYCKKRVRKVKTKAGWKIKREREYNMVGTTDKTGKVKGFGAKGNRVYEGIVQRGVPEFDEWLSIANKFQNPVGANVMIFENWKNTVDLWQAIEKYWKIKNMIIWHLPNRRQGFAARHQFFSKYDIAPLADKGKAVMNEAPEMELETYLEQKGQKLLDTYEVIIYGKQGKSEWNRKSRYFKGGKWGEVADHITWHASSEASTGQNLVFGTKPVQILVSYVKILSPRGGIVMESFGGSGSTILASEIMKRKCRAIEISPLYGEVIINRFEKFTGQKAVKLEE